MINLFHGKEVIGMKRQNKKINSKAIKYHKPHIVKISFSDLKKELLPNLEAICLQEGDGEFSMDTSSVGGACCG